MKKTVKKIACAALCAVILFCMAAPAFALTGSESYSYVDIGIGVRITCNSTLTLVKGTATMVLSFEPNVAHFPPEDYSCSVRLRLYLDDDTYIQAQKYDTAMTVSKYKAIPIGNTVRKAEYKYWLNEYGTLVHTEIIQ
jgi:hypothetical protein